MKKITTLIVLSLMVTGLFAQRGGVAPLAKGEKEVNFGVGLSGWGVPLYVSMDFAVHKDVTITPLINVRFDNDDIWFGALAKADYHWNYLIGIPNNWDFYSGLKLGFVAGNDFELDLGIQVGGRWYWNERWGLNLELGGGTGYDAMFGLSVKI